MFNPNLNLPFDQVAFEAGTLPRNEHLWHCQRRALEKYQSLDLYEAYKSMLLDLIKHEELKDHPGIKIGIGYMLIDGALERNLHIWIIGFN